MIVKIKKSSKSWPKKYTVIKVFFFIRLYVFGLDGLVVGCM